VAVIDDPLVERAPAKINLSLDVLGRRGDGYHELTSLVAFARDVADVIRIAPRAPDDLRLTGPFAGSLSGDNLISNAVALLAAMAPDIRLGTITLEKNLPVAGGIGGGSADAAAVLRIARRLAPVQLADGDWLALARKLGADVPVCFVNKGSFMTGIGERLRDLDYPLQLSAVLVNPQVPVPANKTAEVFQALSAPPRPPDATVPDGEPVLRNRSQLMRYIQSSGNSLQAPAIRLMPVIADVMAELAATAGCQVARLSGAGPTCFGLFDEADEAREAAGDIARRRPDWWVRATQLS